MTLEKRDVLVATIIVFISGAIIDMLLSYIAYLDNPFRFIYLEANREAISFFKNNIIPIRYILIHIIGVILYISAYWYVYVKSTSNRLVMVTNRLSFSLLSIIYMIIGVIHVFGGLTWFDDTGFVIFAVLEGLIVICLSIAFSTLIISIISTGYSIYSVRKYGKCKGT